MVRIALVDQCEHSEEIGQALANAGYDVTHVPDSGASSDAHVVVRVTAERSKSGITSLTPDAERGSDERARLDVGTAPPQGAQAMEAIARLAGGIAHDFNNILSVIAICADEIGSTNPSDATRACLDDIRNAIERGSSVTRDLLAFSRRDMLSPQNIDFNDVLTSCRRTLERIVGDEVTLETTPAECEARVRIDSSQWSSVFINLALNARAAMPHGGSLKLRTRVLTIDPAERGRAKVKGSYVELEVTDTGCGMPKSVQARIFEPFFTTKDRGRATGLGLAVVAAIVEQSGGWIEVTSEVDAGTTFRIYVPSTSEAPGGLSRARPTLVEPPRELSVLVVEDEVPLLRFAVRALQRSGYRVFRAVSAEDALAMMSEIGTLDLLVTDIVLPGMSGRRLAEILLEREPDLAVVYTSGYTDDEVVRHGVSRAQLFFLQKPYSTNALVQRAEDALASRKAKRAIAL